MRREEYAGAALVREATTRLCSQARDVALSLHQTARVRKVATFGDSAAAPANLWA